MATRLFVNLPVTDLAASKRFFTELGFGFNGQFADQNMEAVVISDDTAVLLLVEPYFKSFSNRDVADTASSAEVVLAVGVDRRERVDELAERAATAGGKTVGDPQDLGFMYRRSFADPDGHLWEATYMDMSGMQQG